MTLLVWIACRLLLPFGKRFMSLTPFETHVLTEKNGGMFILSVVCDSMSSSDLQDSVTSQTQISAAL